MFAARTRLSDIQRSSRLLDAAAMLLFAVVLAALSWRLYEHRPTDVVSLDRWALASYRDVVYFPLVALGDAVNPYDSVRDGDPERYMERYPVADHLPLYSPLTLLVFAPLAALPVEASMMAFAALNAALFVLLAWTAIRVTGRQTTVAVVFGVSAFLLASQPGRGAFNAGQLSVPLALAMVGALQWGDRRGWRSAALVAISTMKPTFGGPFGVFLAARRDWRSASIGLAIGAVAFIGGMIAIFAWTGELSVSAVAEVVAGNHTHLSHDPEAVPTTNKARTDLPAVYEYLTQQPVPRGVSVAIAAAIAAITVGALWRARYSRDAETAASPASALIIVAIFICIFHNVYDLLLLVVPLAACVSAADEQWKRMPTACRRWIIVLLLTPFVNIFWTRGFGLLAERAGLPWGENAGAVIGGAYRLSCAANGLALGAVWCILVVSLLLGSRSSETDLFQRLRQRDTDDDSWAHEYFQRNSTRNHRTIDNKSSNEVPASPSKSNDDQSTVVSQ